MTYPCIDLSSRAAIVTGGSRGLGFAIAEGLATAGADVLIVSRNAAAAKEAADRIARQTGRRLEGFAADVRYPEQAFAMVEYAIKTLGSIHILVNNAGVAVTKFALDITENEWDTVLDTHLKGSFFAAQAACHHMKDAGGGVIINISSVAGSVGEKALAAYCAAKGGLTNLTRALALEWARYNIRVVAVAPAYIRTSMNEKWLTDEHVLSRVIQKTPMRRLGTVEEVRNAVTFLASDLASYITGEILYVDGGWMAE